MAGINAAQARPHGCLVRTTGQHRDAGGRPSMDNAYDDPSGIRFPRQRPVDPLLSLPDHPSGEWAAPIRPTPSRSGPPRVGHPRPARASGPYLRSPASPYAYPVVADPGSEPAVLNGRGRTRLLTLLIVLVLVLVGGWQAWRLDRIGSRNDRLAAVLAAEQGKSAQLTERTNRLEKQLAGVFDPEAISSAVLPSVFRVKAGQFTGTAFAVGDK